MATVDPKNLEGRQEENSAPRSREFFWDSIVLFVVLTVLALTGVDLAIEYIRGSSVECFHPQDTSRLSDVQNYINQICADIPLARLLPAAITIHAILIIAPHYLWLNAFGAKLDFFFQHVYGLERTRDETTGEYPQKNYLISRQLYSAFTKSNKMYYGYLFKLALQLTVSAAGLAAILVGLNDYQETFPCSGNDFAENYWPLESRNETVRCVFTSLRLLEQINHLYIILLGIGIVSLLLAFIWCIQLHVSELGIRRLAEYSFWCSVPLNFNPKPAALSGCCPPLASFLFGCLSLFPKCSLRHRSVYNIQCDYDFLLILLFRTEGGLAHILREVHAQTELRLLNEKEYARLYMRKMHLTEEITAKQDYLRADIGWTFPNKEHWHKQIPPDQLLHLPRSPRGAVVGFAARCLGDIEHVKGNPPLVKGRSLSSGLCVCFDSESIGFAGALLQVFTRVGVVNFSQHCIDSTNPVKVSINNEVQLVSIMCPHDILLSGKTIKDRERDVKVETIFLDHLGEVWKPGIIAAKEYDNEKLAERIEKEKKLSNTNRSEDYETGSLDESLQYTEDNLDHWKCDYVVVGPLSDPLQCATVDVLLSKISDNLSQNALLLTVCPNSLSGQSTRGFTSYEPPSFFSKVKQRAVLSRSRSNPWPSAPTSSAPSPIRTPPGLEDTFAWNMKCSSSNCKLRFTLYGRDTSPASGGGAGASIPPPGATQSSRSPLAPASTSEHVSTV